MVGEDTPDHWDCRDIEGVPHSEGLVHNREIEDGLPNYEAQLEGKVKITLCEKCHSRIPGHLLKTRPEELEKYFKIESTKILIYELPDDIVGRGASTTYATRILEACVQDEYNPHQGHAGKALQLSIANQWGKEEWKPPAQNLSFDGVDWPTYDDSREALIDAYLDGTN